MFVNSSCRYLITLYNARLITLNIPSAISFILNTKSYMVLFLIKIHQILIYNLKYLGLSLDSSIFEPRSCCCVVIGNNLLITWSLRTITRGGHVRYSWGLHRNLIWYIVICGICIWLSSKNDIFFVLTVEVFIFVLLKAISMVLLTSSGWGATSSVLRDLRLWIALICLLSLWISYWSCRWSCLICAINMHAVCRPNRTRLTFLALLTLWSMLNLDWWKHISLTLIQLVPRT